MHTSINVAVSSGITLGFGIGGLLQTTLGVPPLAIAVGALCGVGATCAGYIVGGQISDFGGKLCALLEPSKSARGEAIGRGLMTGATAVVLLTNPGLAGAQLALAGLAGGFHYAVGKD